MTFVMTCGRRGKMVNIRRAGRGDEKHLAHIQTESWKAAFDKIIPSELLSKCTETERVTAMYRRLMNENKGNGYILEIDGKPHCIAWWDETREKDMAGFAELICIHSLRDNWHKGYGQMMMDKVLDDAKNAGYTGIMLWVFEKNVRTIRFYKASGFVASERKQSAFGAVEEMYVRKL